jgi:hypothetical protein
MDLHLMITLVPYVAEQQSNAKGKAIRKTALG